MPSAFLKQSKSLRFLTEIYPSALSPPMLLPRSRLTHGNISLSSLLSHLSTFNFHLELPILLALDEDTLLLVLLVKFLLSLVLLSLDSVQELLLLLLIHA